MIAAGERTSKAADWEGVRTWTTPWPAGTHAVRSFGSVVMNVFLPDSKMQGWREEAMERAELEMREGIELKAMALGANGIVGFEETADPFFENSDGETGLLLAGIGTAMLLELL